MTIRVRLFNSYGFNDCWYETLNFEDEKDLESFVRLNPEYTPDEIDGVEVSEKEKERYDRIK